ncbi:hypothetical protein, partial [Polyangium sp. 15x6]|uniref:hypothetical protein n=1 Tax=Polyangium sp. 15x6 TaxID=3042687 RepID=UPI00249B1706
MSEQGDTSTGTYAASAERSPQPAGRPTEGVHREEAQPLTPDTVAEAVVELIRLAIEHEQRFHPDPSIVPHDRDAQIEIHTIFDTRTHPINRPVGPSAPTSHFVGSIDEVRSSGRYIFRAGDICRC